MQIRTSLVVCTLLLAMAVNPAAARRSAAPARPLATASSLAQGLRAAGITVTAAGRITQPFFSVPARVFIAAGADLQVYQYRSAAAAGIDAGKISPSGSAIGTFMAQWMRPPHIFHKHNLIVVYLSDDARVRSWLAARLGPQIAGPQ
ncbi:MAG: hypothetical protein ABI837_08435 [Acidobacteriota bacterium]